MLNSTALDIAIGLALVFLMLSVACSLLNERIQSLLDSRARMLEDAMRKLLGGESGTEQAGRPTETKLFFDVKEHALIRAISHRRSQMPSYISSTTFTQALFDTLVPADGQQSLTFQRLNEAIARLPPSSQPALLALAKSAEGNLATARANVERWFDNAMERLSGAYKRHVGRWLFVIGFVLAAATNADTIMLVQRLEHEGALRAAVVEQAARVDTSAQKLELDRAQIEQMNLLFWDTDRVVTAKDAERYPRAARQPELSLSWLYWLVFKLMGFAMTALAVSLGAPFWFDLLGRLVNLRAAGAKPTKAADGK